MLLHTVIRSELVMLDFGNNDFGQNDKTAECELDAPAAVLSTNPRDFILKNHKNSANDFAENTYTGDFS